MPILQCPECGVEFSHLGKNTGVQCPNRTCEGFVSVGGPSEGRTDAGLSKRDIRERLAERRDRTTLP